MKFGIIGVAGYIAGKHLNAIRETGNEIVAACDIVDSVGILDRFNPDCRFFTDPADFYHYCGAHDVQTISICTPNYLHFENIQNSLNVVPQVIVEKPFVIDLSQFYLLMARDSRMFSIMQLRYHPLLQELMSTVESMNKNWIGVDINYYTPRGEWFSKSWKGDREKSGGLAMNIGIHILDLIDHVFGRFGAVCVVESTHFDDILFVKLKNDVCRISLTLSTKKTKIPLRRITVRDIEAEKTFDFTNGFTNLHTTCYHHILSGTGIHPSESARALELAWFIERTV